MTFMLLRSALEAEFESRCRRNWRYSLRSFSRFLGVDHSTLSKIIWAFPEAVAGFYSKAFGWKIDDANAMGYRRISPSSTEGIQVGIWPAPPQANTFIQIYIGVEDVAASVAKAVSLGAKLLIPPTMLPDGNEMADLHDPQGMSFALWRRVSN